MCVCVCVSVHARMRVCLYMCVCVCVCMYALKIVSLDKILHCLNTSTVIIASSSSYN